MKRKVVLSKLAARFIALFMLLATLLTANINVYAASAEITYTKAVTSYEEIETRLEKLISKYKGKYWTKTGEPAPSSDTKYSLYYNGWQCNGFAKLIFNDLFDCGSIGSYDSNKYYFPNTTVANLIGKAYNIASNDTATVENILSKGKKGDFIQVRRRGKSWGHSMILLDVDSKGIKVFDCNSDGKCGIKVYHQTWATFASKNIGMSLYHAKNYPKKPTKPTITSVSATDATEITIKWNAVSGADTYIIQGRKSGESYETIDEVSGTSFTHKNLKDSSLYWYKVQAANESGKSSFSEAGGAYTKPKATRVSTNDSTTSSLTINWSSCGGSTEYELLARKSGEKEYNTIATVDGYTYTHTGLEPGTQYYYKIKAHNKEHPDIVSMRSDEGFGYTVLNAPSVTGTTPTSVSLYWVRGTMNSEHTYTYLILRKEPHEANFTEISTISQRSFTDNSVKPNTTYIYYIYVLKDGTRCIQSESVTVTTPPQEATGVSIPSNLQLVVGDTYQLTATVSPENTTNKSVSWVSDNTGVAAVSNIGVVTANASGTANITVNTVNGLTARCTVTVKTLQEICSHSFGDWNVMTEATCVTNGNKYRSCSICGLVETDVILAIGHLGYAEYIVDVAPTCTTDGSKSYHCRRCDFRDNITVIPATGHNYVVTSATIESTCEDNGIAEVKTCSACGDRIGGEVIGAIGHNMQLTAAEMPATCTEAGKTAVYTCANGCGTVEGGEIIEATDHSFVITSEGVAPTCTEEGISAIVTCLICGDSIGGETIEPNGHEMEETEAKVEPTCTEAGKTAVYTCANGCGTVEGGEVITATGHSYSTWIVVTPAAAGVSGEEKRTCSVCGDTEIRTIPALDIEIPDDVAKIVIGEVIAAPGNTASVDVSIAQNAGFGGLGFEVAFDSEYIVLTEVITDGAIASFTYTPIEKANADGKVIFMYNEASLSNVTGDGKIATLSFTVAENAPDGEIIPLAATVSRDDCFSYDGEDMRDLLVGNENGSITVRAYTPGDVDDDGKITIRDAAKILQYKARWDVTIVALAADVDCDGKITIRDAARILQYKAGWDVALGAK